MKIYIPRKENMSVINVLSLFCIFLALEFTSSKLLWKNHLHKCHIYPSFFQNPRKNRLLARVFNMRRPNVRCLKFKMSYENSYWRKTLYLWPMWKMFYAKFRFEATRIESQWASIWMWYLFQMVQIKKRLHQASKNLSFRSDKIHARNRAQPWINEFFFGILELSNTSKKMWIEVTKTF